MSVTIKIFDRLKEITNQKSHQQVKYYKLFYYLPGNFYGISLDVLFRCHSIEEAYFKAGQYLFIYAPEYGEMIDDDLVEMDYTIKDELGLDIYDVDTKYSTKDIDDIIDLLIDNFQNNDRLSIKEVRRENYKYIL